MLDQIARFREVLAFIAFIIGTYVFVESYFVNSDEYEKTLKKVADLEASLQDLESSSATKGELRVVKSEYVSEIQFENTIKCLESAIGDSKARLIDLHGKMKKKDLVTVQISGIISESITSGMPRNTIIKLVLLFNHSGPKDALSSDLMRDRKNFSAKAASNISQPEQGGADFHMELVNALLTTKGLNDEIHQALSSIDHDCWSS